jgi:hypothetical protein
MDLFGTKPEAVVGACDHNNESSDVTKCGGAS